MSRMSTELESVLPRLVCAYEAGRLVPFLGAGMSAGACPLWGEFIANLEREAATQGYQSPAADLLAQDGAPNLIRRANHVVRYLKNLDLPGFPHRVRAALAPNTGKARPGPPAQTIALGNLGWPLILTTNYDDWLYYYMARRKVRLSVRGRSPEDCHRVLYSLHAPDEPICWALQGFLGGQDLEGQEAVRKGCHPWKALEDELVIGHEEYRRVTHFSPHFRRAFAEVFRNRSLWFLGTSLSEAYFQDLFGEILEMTGPNPYPHYAFVRRGEADPHFLHTRFNTVVVEMDDYRQLPKWLDEFGKAVQSSHGRPVRWDYAVQCPDRVKEGQACVSLQIIRGELPHPGDGECIAISAGRSLADPFPSHHLHPLLRSILGVSFTSVRQLDGLLEPPAPGGKYVRRFRDKPVFVVVARDADGIRNRRDARMLAEAIQELMARVEESGYPLVRCQLLAGGSRVFPKVTSLIEMVRGYGLWRRSRAGDARTLPSLAIHLVDPDALFAVSTARIDILELLTCEDVRFWVEIVRPFGSVERYLLHLPGNTPLGEITAMFGVPEQGWCIDVYPRPRSDWEPPSLAEIRNPSTPLTLELVGVLHGSTLRLQPAGVK
jgi:SIR2-like protein